MHFNFEIILSLATLISGILAFLDVIYFEKKRNKIHQQKTPWLFEYSRSFFPVLLIVFLLRAFLFEPFRIPSGSDEPTLLVGDFIIVNKFDYGLRLPVLRKKILPIGSPKRGDMVVFLYPLSPSNYFIKRIVALPGDKIDYINKVIHINGQPAEQKLVGKTIDHESGRNGNVPVLIKEENLFGVRHNIYIRPDTPAQDFSYTLPSDNYFVMGDNRDSSNDSRYWGFLPNKNLVGKAIALWFSWNSNTHTVRWLRIGTRIH